MTNSTIFALDIGTRKIAGLLMEKTPQGYRIVKSLIREQQPGAMQDGQIHDIARVAQVIHQVKFEIEESCEQSFSQAAVAAAGRSLQTQLGSSSLKLAPNEKISSHRLKTLELEAVQNALRKLSQGESGRASESNLCVGYSVIHYYLDNQPINALLSHQGSTAGVDVIATFLPRIVLDSLASSLQEADLEMASLTLEPIAAMHLVIPPTMRMLNIALVDVGAGTSDIAISSEGTVKNYGMVPVAGDEMTQAIADSYLLDFMEAERIKRCLTQNGSLECQDVLGNSLLLDKAELEQTIQPMVANLATQISQEILKLNGEKPKGVILIGGGSLTPNLDGELAKALELAPHLVRVRQRESLNQISGDQQFTGPHVITPLGIAASHLDDISMELNSVTVNGRRIQFLRLANSTVGDALLHAGYSLRNLCPRPGQALTIEVNSRVVTIPGSIGKTAAIYHNQKETTVEKTLCGDDAIEVVEPTDGEPAQATLGDIVDVESQFSITINGKLHKISNRVLVNGQAQPASYVLQDKDKVTVEETSTIRKALTEAGFLTEETTKLFVNGEAKSFKRRYKLHVSGRECPLSAPLQPGMDISYNTEPLTIKDVLDFSDQQGIAVTVNGKDLVLPQKSEQPRVNGQPVTRDYQLSSFDHIRYTPKETSKYILSDIFLVYQPDSHVKRGNIQIRINGDDAGYTSPIKSGDVIELGVGA